MRPIVRGTGENWDVTAIGDPLAMRDRLLQATYACIERFGLAKTTVEDVVKESGISRATIYRHFAGRDELIRETVSWEIANYFTELADHVRDEPDLAALLTAGLMHAHQTLGEHALLQKILATEPDRLVGLLSTEAAKTLPFIAAFLTPYIEREREAGRVRPGIDLGDAADFVARCVLSLIGAPGRIDLTDRAAVDEVVRRDVLGGILA
jgi:AcrR family transcriptional regulator